MKSRAALAVFAALLVLTGQFVSPAAHALDPAPVSGRTQATDHIVLFREASRTPGQARTLVTATTTTLGVRPSFTYTHALDGFAASLTPSQVSALRADASVDAVVGDGRVHAEDVCAEPVLGACESTGIMRVGGAGGGSDPDVSGINVAVVDTGIDTEHPDLNVVGGTSCQGDPTYDDGYGHGTHVAGILGATGISGVTGVAPGAPLWAVRVLSSSGTGRWSNVICGLDWVTATRTDADPGNDIDVVNVSLGGRGSDDGHCGRRNDDPVHRAICALTRTGALVVAAAGNGASPLTRERPAAYDEVLTTTAIADYDGAPGGDGGSERCESGLGADDSAARFSDWGEKGDRFHMIAAPGACIFSSWKGARYETISGTSMASPHVAGAAVLCLASGDCPADDPAATMAQLRSDAASFTQVHPARGFQGDPAHRSEHRYYGYLVNVEGY